MWITVALATLGGLAALYLWTQKKFSYFADRGIPHYPASFPFGSDDNRKLLTGKISFNSQFDMLYERFKGQPVVGYYGFLGEKFLVLQDMDLIKDVLIKDFDHFVDRREQLFGHSKYMTNMLVSMQGKKWKTMRSLMSPIFTSGKLKGITPLIDKAADEMVEHLNTFAKEGREFDAKGMMNNFTLDVVGTTGFGIEVNSFKNPNSVFRDNVEKLTKSGKYQRSIFDYIGIIISILFPSLNRLLGFSFFDPKVVDYFVKLIRHQMKCRQNNANSRNDFIDLLTHALSDANEGLEKLDVDLETAVIANSFLLFFAGFDTSSTALATTLYFLAKNPGVQEKLYEEIREALEANNMNQHLGYSEVQGLPYLEMCISESLRNYPIGNLERKCVKEYELKGTNIIVPKGVLVQMPAVKLMKDEKFFPNPDEYNPENFSQESIAQRGSYPFLAFGHGPRNCIGKRFALIQTKIALCRLVANYKILPCHKTVDTLVPDPFSGSQQPIGGMWVKVERRLSDV